MAKVQSQNLKTEHETPFLDHSFTKEEQETAILSTNRKSSASRNGIDYEVIRVLPNTLQTIQ
jgi:hypothetical protein